MKKSSYYLKSWVIWLTFVLCAGIHNQSRSQTIINPILPGFNPDPSILRVGDDYYIATSTFEWFPGVRIHHSRDLVHWELLPHPVNRASQLDMRGNECSGGVWAPCLSYHDGTFYLVYTNVKNISPSFIEADNYLITAENIRGPWSEPVYLNSGGFDPSLFHDDDGRKWVLNLIWDFRRENKSGGIMLQEYSPDSMKLIGKRKLIFKGTDYGGTEAPHIYKSDGFYYLMTAEGGTGYGHVVTMCRSKNIEGQYTLDPENPILTSRFDSTLTLQKAGHASIVQTQTGTWYIAYLCGRPLPGTKYCNLGRETAIQKCFWNDEGWLRMANGTDTPDVRVDAPDLSVVQFENLPARDEFEDDTPALVYNSLRVPFDESWMSLKARPGYLRLKGRGGLSSVFEQSVIARRLTAFKATASTKVDFSPEHYQQMAGLACIYDRRNYIYLRISYDEQMGKNLAIHRYDKKKLTISELVKVDEGKEIFLKVDFNYHSIRFFWSYNGEDWQQIGKEYNAGKLSDDYCRGFTGTFIGLCAQDFSGGERHADFDFFFYENKP